ncbi:DUF4148 domain-containing protein, partial [Pseudomonas aeruginosa]|nr:DUF4148 domain-containing protein [Pseudomonas aeruginosa]
QQAYESYLQLKLGAAYKAPVALTRAQVKSDLADWQVAGMAGFWAGEQTPDTYSDAYRTAFETYQMLRNKK